MCGHCGLNSLSLYSQMTKALTCIVKGRRATRKGKLMSDSAMTVSFDAGTFRLSHYHRLGRLRRRRQKTVLHNGSTHIWNRFGFSFINRFQVDTTMYQKRFVSRNRFVRTE